MHEMAICESIRGIIEEEARRQPFTRVIRIRLAIGVLSGVEPEALRFGFDVAMAGGPAAGALLEIVEEPGGAWCLPCGAQVAIARRYDPCPVCGSHQLQVNDGEGMVIREMEVC